VNNTVPTPDFASAVNPLAEVFTMSGNAGYISSLTMSMNVSTPSASWEVDLYNTSSGAPNVKIAQLGTITDGTIGTLNNVLLAASTQYAIVLQNPGSSLAMQWNYTTSTDPGTGVGANGTVQYGYYTDNDGSTWNRATFTDQESMSHFVNYQMELETSPVPEVPFTGLVFGLGAIAIAAGSKIRNNFARFFSGLPKVTPPV
jgi:hypothetical protein